MKYIKTNEGLFNGKAEKAFAEIIKDLEKRLVDGGYEFKKEPNKIFTGISIKSILKTEDYTIIEKFDNITIKYLMKVNLTKEKILDKPCIKARVEGNQLFDGGIIKSNDSSIMEISVLSLEEIEPAGTSLFSVLDSCKHEILIRNKTEKDANSFYENFPIEEIKDRLVELGDEFESKFRVSKMDSLTDERIGYNLYMDLDFKFKSIYEDATYIRVDKQMDTFTKIISEINNISKTFNSMGLTLFFAIHRLIPEDLWEDEGGSSICMKLYETKSKPK
jgi:hypothetical protein